MPISQVCIEEVILSLLQFGLDTSPAGADGLWIVCNATLIDKSLRDVSLQETCLFHANDQFIVGVEICRDLFGNGRTATTHLHVLDIGCFEGITNESGLATSFRLAGGSLSDC